MVSARKCEETILNHVVTFLLGGLVVACTFDAGAQSSTSYEIARSVMSGGGGRSSSASYDLMGTFGQPSTVWASESSSYNLGSGFWGGMVKLFAVAIENISYSVAEGTRITWHSIAGAKYTVYYTDALSLSTLWNTLSTLTGTGGLMEWLDDGSETGSPPTASGVLKRFYRLSGELGN